MSYRIKRDQGFPGVYWAIRRRRRELATKNLTPGFRSYDERVVRARGVEYRIWSPDRSKPAAGIVKGMKNFSIAPKSKVLYLGIASGTTASHFSDILGHQGVIYGIDPAERVMRDLIRVVRGRGNIVPILASARVPCDYVGMLEEVDAVYADVAQPDQVQMLIDNSNIFLKRGGIAMIAVKASSIDVTRPPKEIYAMARRRLQENGYGVLETIELSPHDRKHAIVVAKKRRP